LRELTLGVVATSDWPFLFEVLGKELRLERLAFASLGSGEERERRNVAGDRYEATCEQYLRLAERVVDDQEFVRSESGGRLCGN